MTFEEIKQGEETYIMHTYGRFPIALDHGKGATLWDTDGKKYIDLTSGIGVNSLGHDNEALTTAVSEQAHKLMHACNLYYTEPMVQAAKKLVDAAGMGKIFFANSGAEANEGMIKLARKYSFDKYGEGRNKIITLSKTYGLAGARVGFCVGNEEVVSHLKTLKSNMDYGMFLPIQKAAIAAISGDQSCVASTRAAYERRRDCLCDGLASIGWKMEKPEGTMFVWAPIPAGFTDSLEFVKSLFEKAGVLVTPGSAFGPSGEGHVRMALVQDEDAINLAVRRIDESGILK